MNFLLSSKSDPFTSGWDPGDTWLEAFSARHGQERRRAGRGRRPGRRAPSRALPRAPQLDLSGKRRWLNGFTAADMSGLRRGVLSASRVNYLHPRDNPETWTLPSAPPHRQGSWGSRARGRRSWDSHSGGPPECPHPTVCTVRSRTSSCRHRF